MINLGTLRSIIRRGHTSLPIRLCASACEKFLRAYYNEDYYDFAKNGERWVLQCFAQHIRCRSHTPRAIVVFDVGAHKGSWASEFLKVLPSSSIFCFEPVPEIADEGRRSFAADTRVTYINRGLSSKDGKAQFTRNFTHDSTNSISPRLGSRFFSEASDITSIDVMLETGDRVLLELGLNGIDVLKIDVEGHEVDVLIGLGGLLSSPGKPEMIQFEYGQTYIPARHFLFEVYELLGSCGYDIGRLYPNFVDFKPYEWGDDSFRMGNYIAVPRHSELRTLLSGQERVA